MPRTVILAGGLGSRLSEETILKPKPLIEIGGRPIIWHIMKIYAAHGITEFIVCLGYRGYAIKEFFANYYLHNSDVVVDTGSGSFEIINRTNENWKIWLIDTGGATMTGGRIKRVLDAVDGDHFCMTYGDGVGDIDITALLEQHLAGNTLATVTAVQMPGRFGSLMLDGRSVSGFQEKPPGDGGWINGGFFVLSPEISCYIKDDTTIWEREPMEALARDGQLQAYFHDGFWQPMDTLRDKQHLEELWSTGQAQWKVW